MIKILLAFSVLFLLGCGNKSSSGNKTPTAVIATQTSVFVSESIILDASGSSDGDGSIASYVWSDNLGTTAMVMWTAPSSAGNYPVTVTVTDNDGATDSETIMIRVNDDVTTPFSTIQTLIASGNATYICVGDSTRANTVPYDGGHVFSELNSTLSSYGVTSVLRARVGHEAKQFNEASASPTWSDVVNDIPGNGSTSIVDISLGINDIFSSENNQAGATLTTIKEAIKSDLLSAINKIKAQKPNTTFMLTMPNPKDPTASSAEEHSALLRSAFIELSNSQNLPLVNVQDEIDFTLPGMFQDDEIHFHLIPEVQPQVADLILEKILP